MHGHGRGKRRLELAALILACMLALASAPKGIGLDVSIDRASGGHAMLRLGVATLQVAFAFEQECPKMNACPAMVS